MHIPEPKGTLFRNIERILTALAACIAGIVTMVICQVLTPELDDPLALLGSAVLALAIFINVFGMAVLLLLLPWEALGTHRMHSSSPTGLSISSGN
jgi:hypothetical protein